MFLCAFFLLCFCACSSMFRLLYVFSFLFFFGSIKESSLKILAAVRSCLFYLQYKDWIEAETKWVDFLCLLFFLASLPYFGSSTSPLELFLTGPNSLTVQRPAKPTQNTPALLVSLAAVFWMSRNVPLVLLGERCVTSKKRDIQRLCYFVSTPVVYSLEPAQLYGHRCAPLS